MYLEIYVCCYVFTSEALYESGYIDAIVAANLLVFSRLSSIA